MLIFGFSAMRKKTHLKFGSMVVVLSLFLAIFGLKGVYCQANDDQKVMSDLKKNLGITDTMWPGTDYCSSWKGIECEGNRVTRIQVKDQPSVITGDLPINLNSLTYLEHLEFRGTQLTGPLPTLKGLANLKELLLSENNFTSIPDDFFSGLTMLTDVAIDKLPLVPREIPTSLQECAQLKSFSMNSVNFIGKIPEFFNANVFATLNILHLTSNNLDGELPSNMSTFTSLASLWLNGQNLSGTIDVLQSMTGLREIWLNKNSFTGPIPDLSGLESLTDLNLRDNQFTGPVPDSLMALKSLRVVNLTNNLLQGPTPKFGDSVEVDMSKNTNKFCTDTGPCSPKVNTMLTIAKNWGYPIRFAQDWDGNSPCSWLGISCPRGEITVINFRGMGLTGTISPNFSSITTLQKLILAENNLYGPIPNEFTSLLELQELDVSNNRLSGKVPSFKNAHVNTTGNPDIGKEIVTPPSPGTSPSGGGGSGVRPPPGAPGESGKKKSWVGVIVGVVVAVVFGILLIGLIAFCVCKKKRKSGRVPNAMVVHPHNSGSDPDMVKITVAGSNVNVGAASETYSLASSGPSDIQMVEAGNMVISIQVLRNVTNNFSEDNVLGRGGFGTVYKGELHDGTKIAVKRMESGVMGSKGLTEFQSEIAVLNKVRHRYLVSLIGYCLDGNERILVYEYMPQGTLSQHLFNWKEEGLKPLEWTKRLIIALDVARAVEYLHGLASQSFIHRDLKPSNILLGDDMRAKVADFGLVRLAPEGKASIETRLAGTFGYLAPEYAATGRVTTKVDVYAFGVILMELITGRRALDESQPEESMHLVTWFRRMSINKDTARKAIDPTIDADEEALASISRVSELAGYCCSREPYQRPDMGHVVNVLSSLVELWKPSDTDPEDIYAIDMELSLAQTLKKWQAFDGESSMERSYLGDNTQSSIPPAPSGFVNSFTSTDGR